MTTMNEYRAALQAHDWFYMYADDYRSFEKGKEQWASINLMQKKIDPDFTVFNEYAPPAMQVSVKPGEQA